MLRKKKIIYKSLALADVPWKGKIKKIMNQSLTFADFTTDEHLHRLGLLGAKRLAEILKNPQCKLNSLKLFGNRIKDGGVVQIVSALPRSFVTFIDLGDNQITDKGFKALFQILVRPSSRILSLDCTQNIMRDTHMEEFAELLQRPDSKLLNLNLNQTMLSEKGMIAMAKAFKSPHCKLVWFKCDSVRFKSNEDMALFLDSIRTNENLLFLGLNGAIANEAEEILNRNRVVFTNTCNSLLAGDQVLPAHKQRLLLQATAILDDAPRLNRPNPEESMCNLAVAVIKALQMEYDSGLSYNLNSILSTSLPAELIGIAMQYIKGDVSALYVSFDDQSQPIQQAYHNSRKRKRAVSISEPIAMDDGEENSLDNLPADHVGDDAPNGNGVQAQPNQPGENPSDDGEAPTNRQQLKASGSSESKLSDFKQTFSTASTTSTKRTEEDLLTTMFSWLKDLPQSILQQILTSEAMQQILELLSPSLGPTHDQMPDNSIENTFESYHQEHYGQYNLTSLDEEYAQKHDLATSGLLATDLMVSI